MQQSALQRADHGGGRGCFPSTLAATLAFGLLLAASTLTLFFSSHSSFVLCSFFAAPHPRLPNAKME